MPRFHLVRNLRSIAFVLVAASILAVIGTLWWANQTGLPDSWRLAIEQEISKHGTHVKIGSLSYHPLRGVVAKKVRIYSDARRQKEISRLEGLILDFDNTKLARGKLHLTKVELSNATLTLPIDPEKPDSEVLKITNANGVFFLPGKRRIEIRNATGMVSGIRITLNARLSDDSKMQGSDAIQPEHGKRNELIVRILRELKNWSFDLNQPPELKIFLKGDPKKTDAIIANLSFSAKAIEKNQHRLDEVTAEAEINGNLLTVTSLEAIDGNRSLHGHLDFDLNDQSGRFDLKSTLEIPPLLQSWFGLPPVRDVLISGKQKVSAEGEFEFQPAHGLKVHMTGKGRCESALLRGIRFDTIESSFAWLDGDLFLKDIHLASPDGEAHGKALIQWPLVRMSLASSLLPELYQPLFEGKPLEKVIRQFGKSEDSDFYIELEGGFDATNRQSWAYTGLGRAKNIIYREVPVNEANCNFALSSNQLDFTKGRVQFNYEDYALRQMFDGPDNGSASFDRIQYTSGNKLLELVGVRGDVWAAPLVRLFNNRIADSLESYRFHAPAQLAGSGTIDIAKKGRTHLEVTFNSNSNADYTLLNSNITLANPSGKVTINDEEIAINDLRFDAFNGAAVVDLSFHENKFMMGEVQWTKFSINDINSSYGLNLKCGGAITGRSEFSMTVGKIDTLDGKGLFALEKSELFSVPIFGPLSPLISGVLRDRRSGFERAKSAFCSFKIADGVLSTDDFKTSTTSLVFTGDGSVDLNDKSIDMTMRLNARGLLGFITLPFRPFYGLFQFRGTGPLKQTKWKSVMFTTPGEKQKKILFEAPKAKIVEPAEEQDAS